MNEFIYLMDQHPNISGFGGILLGIIVVILLHLIDCPIKRIYITLLVVVIVLSTMIYSIDVEKQCKTQQSYSYDKCVLLTTQ